MSAVPTTPSDGPPPLEVTLQHCAEQSPAEGFVIIGDNTKFHKGSVTGFARVGDELWATSQGYGEGREPEVRWKRGEVRLLPVLVKAIKELGNKTNYTWQAWDHPIPEHEDPFANTRPNKVLIGFVYENEAGQAVSPPTRRIHAPEPTLTKCLERPRSSVASRTRSKRALSSTTNNGNSPDGLSTSEARPPSDPLPPLNFLHTILQQAKDKTLF